MVAGSGLFLALKWLIFKIFFWHPWLAGIPEPFRNHGSQVHTFPKPCILICGLFCILFLDCVPGAGDSNNFDADSNTIKCYEWTQAVRAASNKSTSSQLSSACKKSARRVWHSQPLLHSSETRQSFLVCNDKVLQLTLAPPIFQISVRLTLSVRMTMSATAVNALRWSAIPNVTHTPTRIARSMITQPIATVKVAT